jgi:hypothetical protein
VILRARFAAKRRREIVPTPRVNEFGAGLQCAMIALFSFFCRAQETFSARAGKPSADFADDTDLKQKAKLSHLFVRAVWPGANGDGARDGSKQFVQHDDARPGRESRPQISQMTQI